MYLDTYEKNEGTLSSVNAMKQTCVIVILAYFTLFKPNSH